ncbi:TadE/TadG family type IV pilus assembly protein [Geodermatophilus marinus]|uniref:TadE/TadG family type IV pilus assembly protein n=1 Tax=Geodermatophilus sp. LHW52908 TaxID=2303986 RepID=UPI000E3CC783|nr:TadE/TadG family type IV pilus assembly protein [Geodermatophilus sp. LHW52908]RFU18837.1 pilus assembly protein [Geodermatophilus sp. LHW52908]
MAERRRPGRGRLRVPRLPGAAGAERGGAVVEFVLVSVLVVVLLLAVLQVAVYVHVRNVVTAGAQEGARFAANADVPAAAGADRTLAVVAAATSPATAAGLRCAAGEETDASGLRLVVVRCSGAVPTLLAGLGSLLPLEVTGRAVEEGP